MKNLKIIFGVLLIMSALLAGKDSLKVHNAQGKCIPGKTTASRCTDCKAGSKIKKSSDKFIDKNKNGICDERECCLGTKKCFTSGVKAAK